MLQLALSKFYKLYLISTFSYGYLGFFKQLILVINASFGYKHTFLLYFVGLCAVILALMVALR